MWSIRYSFQILIKLELFRQILEKYSNIKFHDNPFIGSEVLPWGRTDRQDDFANEAKNVVFIDFVRFKQISVAIYLLVCPVHKFSMNIAEVRAYRDWNYVVGVLKANCNNIVLQWPTCAF